MTQPLQLQPVPACARPCCWEGAAGLRALPLAAGAWRVDLDVPCALAPVIPPVLVPVVPPVGGAGADTDSDTDVDVDTDSDSDSDSDSGDTDVLSPSSPSSPSSSASGSLLHLSDAAILEQLDSFISSAIVQPPPAPQQQPLPPPQPEPATTAEATGLQSY